MAAKVYPRPIHSLKPGSPKQKTLNNRCMFKWLKLGCHWREKLIAKVQRDMRQLFVGKRRGSGFRGASVHSETVGRA
jgi:hypothetical protein